MITMKNIIKDPHPNLRKKSFLVEFPLKTKEKILIDNLLEFVKNSNNPKKQKKYNLIPSVGIAAVQVNVLKKIAVIYSLDKDNNYKEFVLINPKIIKHSVEKIYIPEGEGCLSVIEKHEGIVERYQNITVENYTKDGKKEYLSFDDYMSIIAQHEIDHLNGILFYDHIKNT